MFIVLIVDAAISCARPAALGHVHCDAFSPNRLVVPNQPGPQSREDIGMRGAKGVLLLAVDLADDDTIDPEVGKHFLYSPTT